MTNTKELNIEGLNVPKHIAIIMDGNRRWAKKRNLPGKAGHKFGVDAVQRTVDNCLELGVRYLTLYAFSTENWSRSEDEVKTLMSLLKYYLEKEISEVADKDVQVRFIGDRNKLEPKIIKLMEKLEEQTKNNSSLQLNIALNYGGRQEILDSTKNIIKDVVEKKINIEDLTIDNFGGYLYTKDTPDPDLMIRTSGEYRTSNFLIWQLAYSEFVFLETYWPDFDKEHLVAAIKEYNNRDRRYGGA